MKINNELKKKFNLLPYSESQQYHHATKLTKFIEKKGSINNGPKEWFHIFYKGYPKFEKIVLPKKINLDNVKLLHALSKRKTLREYSGKELNFSKLGTLLYYSAGLRNKNRKAGNRFYPSAGARYPLETYIVSFNTKGLKQGIYHYHLRSGKLEFLWTKKHFKEVLMKNFNQDWISNAGALIVISAVFWRNEMKYRDRGYRHTLTELGALTQ
ncbi:MAG: SagB/ThcOx family dehydrogenase, partial [Microgenomates group bacterium]